MLLIIVTLFSFPVHFFCDAKIDSSSILFDSSGRLHQVEYAYKATTLGNSIVAAKESDFCIIIVLTPKLSSILPSSKVIKLNKNLCITASGINADFRYIRNKINHIISNHIYNYGTEPPIHRLGTSIAEIFHEKTLYAGQRPLGIRLLLIGKDLNHKQGSQPTILEIDPFGNSYQCNAAFLGLYGEQISKLWTPFILPTSTSTSSSIQEKVLKFIKHTVEIVKDSVVKENEDPCSYHFTIGLLSRDVGYYELSESAVENALELGTFDDIFNELTSLNI